MVMDMLTREVRNLHKLMFADDIVICREQVKENLERRRSVMERNEGSAEEHVWMRGTMRQEKSGGQHWRKCKQADGKEWRKN